MCDISISIIRFERPCNNNVPCL